MDKSAESEGAGDDDEAVTVQLVSAADMNRMRRDRFRARRFGALKPAPGVDETDAAGEKEHFRPVWPAWRVAAAVVSCAVEYKKYRR